MRSTISATTSARVKDPVTKLRFTNHWHRRFVLECALGPLRASVMALSRELAASPGLLEVASVPRHGAPESLGQAGRRAPLQQRRSPVDPGAEMLEVGARGEMGAYEFAGAGDEYPTVGEGWQTRKPSVHDPWLGYRQDELTASATMVRLLPHDLFGLVARLQVAAHIPRPSHLGILAMPRARRL